MLATECWYYRDVARGLDSLLTEIRGLDILLTEGRDWNSVLTDIRVLDSLLTEGRTGIVYCLVVGSWIVY